jgi:hypothetical protein
MWQSCLDNTVIIHCPLPMYYPPTSLCLPIYLPTCRAFYHRIGYQAKTGHSIGVLHQLSRNGLPMDAALVAVGSPLALVCFISLNLSQWVPQASNEWFVIPEFEDVQTNQYHH